jgi:hypothetical protein
VTIWKFRRKDGGDPVHVYILVEFSHGRFG